MKKIEKILNLERIIPLSIIALFFYIGSFKTIWELLLSVLLCFVVFVYVKKKEVEIRKLDLFISLCVALLLCFKNITFVYSSYAFLAGYSSALGFVALFLLCVVSFPVIYRVALLIGNACDELFKHDKLPNNLSKILVGVIIFRFLACTVFEYILYIDLVKTIDLFLLTYIVIVGFIYTANRLFKQKNGIIYYAMLLMFVMISFSVFVNGILTDIACISENMADLFTMAFCVFVLYPVGEWIVRNNRMFLVTKYLRPLYYIWSLGIVFVLFKVYLNIDIKFFNYIYFDGFLILNEYYNIVARQIGAFSFIGMLLLTYDKDWKTYAVDILFLLANHIAIILCNSRGASYAYFICIAIAILFAMLDKTNNILVSSLTTACIFAFIYVTKELPFVAFELLSAQTSSISSAEGFRDFDVDQAGTLNGRLIIWKYCMQGFFADIKTFLFGVTHSRTGTFLAKASNGVRTDFHTHNVFLEVACGSGIFAFVPYVIFIIKTGLDCLVLLFRKVTVQIKVIIPFVFFVFISYFIESSFIYDDVICTYLFFIAAGIVITTFKTEVKFIKKEEN